MIVIWSEQFPAGTCVQEWHLSQSTQIAPTYVEDRGARYIRGEAIHAAASPSSGKPLGLIGLARPCHAFTQLRGGRLFEPVPRQIGSGIRR